jgi:hypothetical protein
MGKEGKVLPKRVAALYLGGGDPGVREIRPSLAMADGEDEIR